MSETVPKEDFLQAIGGFGEHIASHFRAPSTEKRLIEFAATRATLFQAGGVSLPATIDRSMVFEFGGIDPNESFIVALVDVEQSHALREHLSTVLSYPARPDNTVAAYGLRRFVDVKASRKTGQLVIRSNAFIACITRPSDEILSIHVLTPSGLQPIMLCRIPESVPDDIVQRARANLDKKIPHSSSMYRGLFQKLLVNVDGGLKEYDYQTSGALYEDSSMYEFALLKEETPKSISEVSFPVVTDYVQVPLAGGGLGLIPGVSSRTTDAPPPGISFGDGSDDGSDPNAPGVGTTYGGFTGQGEQEWGPPGPGAIWYCYGFQGKDACLSCCQNGYALVTGSEVTIGVAVGAAISWTIIGGIIFGIVAAAVAVGTYYLYTVCMGNCNKQFWNEG